MSRVLLASLTFAMGVAALTLAVKPAAAGVLETPAGGFGVIDRPVPQPGGGGFVPTGTSGGKI